MRGHVLPVLQLILLPVCCTATYVWSVLLGHVEAGFPYISDTGTYPPESCLFGLLLDIYATVTAVSVFLRWKQVRIFYESDGSRGLHRLNNIGLVLGLIASFGILLVANFQETNVIVVHLLGALLAFAVGSVYTWFQTVISYKGHLLPGHKACLRHLRLGLSVCLTLSFVMVLVFGTLANKKQDKDDNQDSHGGHWTKEMKGFKEHVVSTAFEWALAFLSAIYFATFYSEFRHFTINIPLQFGDPEENKLQVNNNEVKVNNEEVLRASFSISNDGAY